MIAVTALGVRVQVSTDDPELMPAIRKVMPPASVAAAGPPGPAHEGFRITRGSDDLYNVFDGTQMLAVDVEPAIATGILDAQVRMRIATLSTSHVVVHAGAVAHDGVGIVLPGKSFAGKSTLVAALLEAGASYYSDELAVIDRDGLLHAYARPISLRPPVAESGTRVDAGEDEREPVAVGLVAIASYAPGATWNPIERTAGEGALALLANTPAARAQAARVMPVLTRAVRGARVLEGARGEAAATATALLEQISRG